MQVTAQETFGDSTDVTLKTNRFVYNAEGQEPKVIVRSSDVVLKEGQDYELSYENNRNAGTATVTVKGAGCYLGSVSRTFTILPAQIQIRAKDRTILVGDAVPASGTYEYEISGLMGTDKLLTEPTLSCAVTDTAVTARYDIIPAGAVFLVFQFFKCTAFHFSVIIKVFMRHILMWVHQYEHDV